MHDWTRVDVSIFHAFHHQWTSEIKRTLNRGLLSPDRYAMIEPPAERCRLAAQITPNDSGGVTSGGITVRHVSGDRIVAMIEIVSPGNKSSRAAFKAFVDKACELLEHRVHLLLIDPSDRRCEQARTCDGPPGPGVAYKTACPPAAFTPVADRV